MRIGMNLPGPFYASMRVGGRRRRNDTGLLANLLIVWPIMACYWMLYAVVWIYWQAFRVAVYLLQAVYRWLAPIVRRRFIAWRETRSAKNPPSTWR